ncbi:MAG: hypothetical protein KKA73_07790, partial [Chloroflexi bacterium]|nr:hypothetical protein [Chloroflexota bacterium]
MSGVLAGPPFLPYVSSLLPLLECRRLPTYSGLDQSLLGGYRLADFWYLWDLWSTFLAGVPPANSTAQEALTDFMDEVDQRLFPVDLWASHEYLSAADEEDLLEWTPLCIAGLGVPWESVGIDNLDPSEQVMVAVVSTALGYLGRCHESILDWWQQRGYDDIPALTWPRHPEVAVALLEDLDPPLDGLAVLYQCVVKDTGNPFLDLPDGRWQGVYLDDDHEGWCWEPGAIRELAQAYATVRPDVLQLEAYTTWWQSTRRVETRVLSV